MGERVACWSNKTFLPKIGERVRINFNHFGCGEVVAYFVEGGGTPTRPRSFLGIEVRLYAQPDWHIKQHFAGKHALVFGAEVSEP